MKTLFVSELKNGASFVDVVFGISALSVSEDRNGRPYWSLSLLDKSGTIPAKVWSELVAQLAGLSFKPGDLCSVCGTVGEYRGQLQLTVTSLKKAELASQDLTDFLPCTDEDLAGLEQKIVSYLAKIEDPELQELLISLFDYYKQDYLRSPAATRNHHNFVGGLAEHVCEMLEVAEVMLKHYPEANPDLVYAGIIMHDIGKLKELTLNGFVFEYTAEGKLLGHITIGVNMLESFIAKHPDRFAKLEDSFKIALLKHIILSHHSKLEFGSPVRPGTIEAGIVAKVDILSSEVRIFQRVLNENQNSDGDFSPGEFALERTEIYLKTKSATLSNTSKQQTNQAKAQPASQAPLI